MLHIFVKHFSWMQGKTKVHQSHPGIQSVAAIQVFLDGPYGECANPFFVQNFLENCMKIKEIAEVDPGFPVGASNLGGGGNIRFCQNFQKTASNREIFWAIGGCLLRSVTKGGLRPGGDVLLDPPMSGYNYLGLVYFILMCSTRLFFPGTSPRQCTLIILPRYFDTFS